MELHEQLWAQAEAMARVAHEPPACGPTNGTEDCGDVESVVDPGSPTRPSEIQSNHEPPSLASPVGLFGKFGVGMKGQGQTTPFSCDKTWVGFCLLRDTRCMKRFVSVAV